MISLVYILLFVLLSAYIDWEHLRQNEYIESHRSRWLLRSLFIVASSDSLLDVIGMSFMFMATFDQVLNLLMGRPFWYLGDVAKWDVTFKKYESLYVSFKLSCLITGIVCLVC